jgi:hypothetical protein
MRAFLRILLGDAWNVGVVAVIVLAAFVLTASGHRQAAAWLIPALTLAGVALLTRR